MINNFSLNEKIFIAGSNWMVGSAIKRALYKCGYSNPSIKGKILAPNRSELDLTNYYLLENWFNPHSIGYTDLLEKQQELIKQSIILYYHTHSLRNLYEAKRNQYIFNATSVSHTIYSSWWTSQAEI